MADIAETPVWEDAVVQIETTDLVLGGASGPPNLQAQDLANRTAYLKARIESLTEQPLAAIPYPTIATADNRLAITPAAATAGGTVSIAAGGRLTLAEEVAAAATGRMRSHITSAYTSADLLANQTYFLRAQVDGNGDLLLYTQRGADDDPIPAGSKGTPDGASGGGFDSTRIDMLIAKVQTGNSGTIPVVTSLANAALFVIDLFDNMVCTAAGAFVTKTHTLALARKIEPNVSLQCWSATSPAGGNVLGQYRDGSDLTYNRSPDAGTIIQAVFAFASSADRYGIVVSAENIESIAANEANNAVWYQVSVRG